MPNTDRKSDPLLDSILRLMETAAVLGLTYCILLLTGLLDMATATVPQLLIYGGWFVAAAVSVHAMLNRVRWGAYTLGAATLLVTIYEFVSGNATLGGAALGLIVLLVIAAYLYPFQRFTN